MLHAKTHQLYGCRSVAAHCSLALTVSCACSCRGAGDGAGCSTCCISCIISIACMHSALRRMAPAAALAVHRHSNMHGDSSHMHDSASVAIHTQQSATHLP